MKMVYPNFSCTMNSHLVLYENLNDTMQKLIIFDSLKSELNCSMCKKIKDKKMFSISQLKKGVKKRCRTCVDKITFSSQNLQHHIPKSDGQKCGPYQKNGHQMSGYPMKYCSYCGNKGHERSTCRKLIYASKKCSRCKRAGHVVSECLIKYCDYCNNKGHERSNCRKLQYDSKKCTRCHKIGHEVSECRTKYCNYCCKKGHESRSCRKLQYDSKKCDRCGKIGHEYLECRLKICRYCNKMGHVEEECRMKKKMFYFCDQCNCEGHSIAFCSKYDQRSKHFHKDNIKRLCNSNFKKWYDVWKNEDFTTVDIQSSILQWLMYRKVENANEVASKFSSDPEKCLKLWTSTHFKLYHIPIGENIYEPKPFYRFINYELQKDSKKVMPFVTFLVRLFNTRLAHNLRGHRFKTLYRSTHIPHKHLQGFFFKQVLASGGWFRIKGFFATSPLFKTAEEFRNNKFISTKNTVPVRYVIKVPKVLYHGMEISSISLYAEEREFLFPPYSLFYVNPKQIYETLISYNKNDDILIINLEASSCNKTHECCPVFHWT